MFVSTALQTGVSAYVGAGLNRWPAAHVTDVARLYRLALEKHEDGSKYHAVDEEGVTLRDIAQALGRALHLPVVSIDPEKLQRTSAFSQCSLASIFVLQVR